MNTTAPKTEASSQIPIAKNPFHFVTQVPQVELTGLKAHDLHELASLLQTVPGSVIYHHTHHFLLQHQFLSPEPPNDFAYWATNVLGEDAIGERLAAIDTVRQPSIRALREELIRVLQKGLDRGKPSRTAPPGEEFHFMKSRSFILPTPYRVSTLPEFRDALQKVSLRSVYHHIFESRLRLEKGSNDFSRWLTSELGEAKLAEGMTQLDPYTQTLETLRKHLVGLIDKRLKGAPYAA